jgi:hypothetical protein
MLAARAAAAINGEIDVGVPALPQATVDRLMRRSARGEVRPSRIPDARETLSV